MNSDSLDLKTAMLDRIHADAPRKVWTPSDFVDLASRDAVDKALQRLTKAEILRRIDRGLYDQPGFNKLTQKPNPPDPRSVIDAVGRRDQTRMLVDGMTAANDLGLTDAVPAKIVVHTDARRRAIKLGNVTITFRPTAASKLFWAGRPAMRVVQALHWLRDLLGREGESDQIKRKLAKLFEDPTAGPLLKADLIAGMTALPTWMWVFLKPLIESDTDARRRHIDDDRAADAADDDHHHVGADHDHHRHRRIDDDDDQRHAAVVRPKRKPLSTQKTRTAKRGATRAAKT
ncbi:Transcriptional regulator, AbiEi antitoxin, Type IV TA system [Rhizobiales bacterium GAS191]|nr:Transcriptional regulator, AbiEi antitoxin, Type IV TA system [Rhizobiales bacterium GAS191]